MIYSTGRTQIWYTNGPNGPKFLHSNVIGNVVDCDYMDYFGGVEYKASNAFGNTIKQSEDYVNIGYYSGAPKNYVPEMPNYLGSAREDIIRKGLCDMNHPVYNESMQLMSKGVKFAISAWVLMHIRKYLYNKADASLNYCTYGKELWPTYGVPQEKIFVRYNSGDTEALFATKNQVKDAPNVMPVCDNRILHIGRLVAWKRVDLLIEAYEKVFEQYPYSELTIVGDGPEMQKLKQQAEKSRAVCNIRFVGGIYDPFELGRYMNESSIYVLAGMGGLSINDAMCYELPVICSVCDGTEKDLVEDGKNGYFFREDDADDLAAKIIMLLSNNDKRKQMRKESLRIIREKININTVAENYYLVFRTVLKK
jgi:glycosyltransferase involved in cell wall biosynthesis